jgi:hypothetical protein
MVGTLPARAARPASLAAARDAKVVRPLRARGRGTTALAGAATERGAGGGQEGGSRTAAAEDPAAPPTAAPSSSSPRSATKQRLRAALRALAPPPPRAAGPLPPASLEESDSDVGARDSSPSGRDRFQRGGRVGALELRDGCARAGGAGKVRTGASATALWRWGNRTTEVRRCGGTGMAGGGGSVVETVTKTPAAAARGGGEGAGIMKKRAGCVGSGPEREKRREENERKEERGLPTSGGRVHSEVERRRRTVGTHGGGYGRYPVASLLLTVPLGCTRSRGWGGARSL